MFHDMFEPTECDYPKLVSNISKNFIFCMMFVSVYPMVGFLALVGFLLCYKADKYFILRRAKRPRELDDDIIFKSLDLIFMGLFGLSIAHFLHSQAISVSK